MGVTPKNGNWHIDYRLPNGKRRREKIGKSKKLAETILAKRQVEIAENKYLDRPKNQRIKFETFADEYFTLHSKANKKSWKSDFYNLQTLKRHFSGKFLYEVTVKDIEQFKSDRLKIISKTAKRCKTLSSIDQELKAVSPATVNRELATLKTMLGKAVVWGKLHENVGTKVHYLREPKGRLRFLEREEIVKLLINCNKKLRPILVLALNTGMRRGEIFGLKWTDVDLKRNILTLIETKNGEKREVPVNEQIKTALLRVPKHPDSPYVFSNQDGKPLHDIRKSFSTALAKSGIKDFRFHDLRHTFASQLVMVGIDLNTTRELLGHKDLRMTLRYAHLSPNYKQRAVDILGKKLDTFWTLSQNLSDTTQMSNTQHTENKHT